MIVILAILLLIMFYQDIKSREISVILFPGVFILAMIISINHLQINQLIYNIAFLTVLLLLLTIYLSVKNSRFIRITEGYFSWGDCLFLLAIIPLFEINTFILFFTMGTLLVLVLYLLFLPLFKTKTIPYAGFLGLILIGHLFYPEWEIHFYSLLNHI